MSYIIGSGWWCDGTGKHAGSANNDSTDEIRQRGFFDWWYRSVKKVSHPQKIIVVDSASSIKPCLDGKDDVEFVSLVCNFNQKTEQNRFGTPRTGATRAFFIGAFYALMNDVDYFVWVEQDCLLHGVGIIEKALSAGGDKMEISHGMWNHIYKVETSFIIVKTSIVPHLYDVYLKLPGDRPEKRWQQVDECFDFVELPFGYGRNRPINFDDEFFFAQQLTQEELVRFKEKIRS